MNYVILFAGLYLLFIGLKMDTKGMASFIMFKFIPTLLGGWLIVAAILKLFPSLLSLS